jgi:hypothetical protein
VASRRLLVAKSASAWADAASVITWTVLYSGCTESTGPGRLGSNLQHPVPKADPTCPLCVWRSAQLRVSAGMSVMCSSVRSREPEVDSRGSTRSWPARQAGIRDRRRRAWPSPRCAHLVPWRPRHRRPVGTGAEQHIVSAVTRSLPPARPTNARSHRSGWPGPGARRCRRPGPGPPATRPGRARRL